MGVLVRRDRGRWWVVVHANGVRRRKCVGMDRQAAERVAREARLSLARGELGIFHRTETPVSVRELAARYLKEAVALRLESGELPRARPEPGRSRSASTSSPSSVTRTSGLYAPRRSGPSRWPWRSEAAPAVRGRARS